MAITYVATGTRSKVGSGSMSPGMPTGWAADDILICQAVTENNATLSIASGWTLVDSIVSTSGQNTRAVWWWRRAVAGDTAPSITGATGGAMSCIHAFRGCTTSGTPYRTGGGYSSNAPAASLTLTAATITPGSADDMVVWLGCIEAEFNTTSVSGYSGTNPTFTEGVDDTNSSGANYTGLCMAYGLSTDGSATGSRTATIATPTTAHHISFLIALIPAGSGAITLTVADATHSHAVDNVALTQANVLAIADAAHGHAVDAVSLTQAYVLAVADAVHSNSADSVTLSFAALLAVADSTHGHAVDNLNLTQAHILAVADALHAHAAGNVDLTQANVLAVSDATHGHAAESSTLEVGGFLAVANAAHGQLVDNVSLVQAHILTVADGTHSHTVDNIVLSEATLLAVADALHAHGVDAVALTQAHVLAIASAVHAHLADTIDLTQANVLVISDALHAQLVDALTLRLPSDTAGLPVFVIRAERRTFVIARESSKFTIRTVH